MKEQKSNTNYSTEIENLIKIIQSVQYGSVTVVIQDSKIVQIEKNEKLRLK